MKLAWEMNYITKEQLVDVDTRYTYTINRGDGWAYMHSTPN